MQTFIIRRRSAWASGQELEQTATLSSRIGDEEMPDRVRWLRSYVVMESDGRLGTLCVYQAKDEGALREHARRVGMPADEITPVSRTVVIRDDP